MTNREPEVTTTAKTDIEGWRVTHGANSSVFEHPGRARIEIRDPIRDFWKSSLQERLGFPISEQRSTEVGKRRMDFVLFENGAIFLDIDANVFFEVHRDTQEILERIKEGVGSWNKPFQEGVVGVHAALLHTNEVLLFTYDSKSPNDKFPTQDGEWSLLSLKTSRLIVPPGLIGRNLFCGGQCLLGDGRLLVVGGERDDDLNQRSVHLFDPAQRSWIPRTDMTTHRWYPTVATLRSNVGVVVGGDKVGVGSVPYSQANATAEYVDADGPRSQQPLAFGSTFKSFTLDGNAGTTTQYPFVFLLPPSGKVFVHFRDTSHILPPGSFDFGLAQIAREGRIRTTAAYGTAVMLPLRPADDPPYRARIMVMGGPVDRSRKPGGCAILDTAAAVPQWEQIDAAMSGDRQFCDSVLLPDGKVLVVNGCGATKANPILRPELFDPKTKTWWPLPLAEMGIPRLYHSTALLLPDGSVLTAGTDQKLNTGPEPEKIKYSEDQRELERFSPPYLFAGPRPVNRWTPREIGYDSIFEIAADDVATISSVALIRNGSCTHSFNSDQRFIELQITRRIESRRWLVGSSRPGSFYELFYAEGLTLRAPPNGFVAPPGYYMLFLVSDNGVPSVAEFVRLVPRHSLWTIVGRVISNVLRTVLAAVFRRPGH